MTRIFYHRNDFSQLLNYLNLNGEGCVVGVWNGAFAQTILNRWEGQKLYAIDPPPQPQVVSPENPTSPQPPAQASEAARNEARLRLFPYEARALFLEKSSAEASQSFADGALDFVYLDAITNPKSLSEDLGCWYPKLRAGGLLAGRDLEAEKEESQRVNPGVRAFAQTGRLRIYVTSEPTGPSWILQKPIGTGEGAIKALESFAPKTSNLETPERESGAAVQFRKTSGLRSNWFRLKAGFDRVRGILQRASNRLADIQRIRVELRNEALIRGNLARSLQDSITGEAHPAKYYPSYQMLRFNRTLKPQRKVYDKERPTVVSLSVGDAYAKLVQPCLNSQIKYCQEHQYNFIILRDGTHPFDRPISWLKLPLLHLLLSEGFEQIVYFDADVLITNHQIKVEPFFQRLKSARQHMLIADDFNGLNFGIFFIKNSWQMRNLLDLVYSNDSDVEHLWWEQNALIELLSRIPCLNELLLVETQARLFNAQPVGDYQLQVWKPGDFLCHFAGFHRAELVAEIDRVCLESQTYFDHSPFRPAIAKSINPGRDSNQDRPVTSLSIPTDKA